jgi:hypothetical protein
VATLDNWDALELWRGGKRTRASGGKDKGHRAGLQAFLAACRAGGAWPVPWEELRAVSAAALLAVQSLRDGFPHESA